MQKLFSEVTSVVLAGMLVSGFQLNGAVTWMRDQIAEDLKPFSGRVIKKSELLKELELPEAKTHKLILVEIRNNKLLLSGHLETFPEVVTFLRDYFDGLLRKRTLPPVSFLLTLHDSLDRVCKTEALPIFAFAKQSSACSVLLPDFEALVLHDGHLDEYESYCSRYPWRAKQEIMFWRGASTGALISLDNYRFVPRIKLVMLGGKASSWLDAGLVKLCQGAENIPELHSFLKPFESIKNHFAYKYLIDVDGNSCTYSRCRWILLSNSVLVKQESQNVQWYYKALQPYEHYIPVRHDLSNLEEQYHWLKAHDKEAKRIAHAGRKLGKSIFSAQAIADYIELLLREYATLYRDE